LGERVRSGYRLPGLNAESTSLSYLKALFEAAGLTDVDTRPIEIPVTFQDFDDYWNSNTTIASPIGGYVKKSFRRKTTAAYAVGSMQPGAAPDIAKVKIQNPILLDPARANHFTIC
jgi:hypothetical protein